MTSKYCTDGCPIYHAIEEYNHSHFKEGDKRISCNSDFCKYINDVIDANEKNERARRRGKQHDD